MYPEISFQMTSNQTSFNNGYTRIILNTTLTNESEAYFELDDLIRKTTNAYFDEGLLYRCSFPSTYRHQNICKS